MINPNDGQQMSRLRKSIDWSRQKLSKFRRNYRNMIQQYVTDNYFDSQYSEEPKEVLVNLLGQAVNITVKHLAPANPQVNISSDFQEYGPMAYSFELAINRDLERMGVGCVMEEVAMDAWFAMGICKLFHGPGNHVEIEGERIDIGDLQLASISLDNWVHDCNARKWSECVFYGDRRRERLYDIQNSEIYENKDTLVGKQLQMTYDEDGSDRISDFTTEGDNDEAAFPVDYIELWDIFLPREQLLITVPADVATAEGLPLRVVDWKGPPHGPYHMVSLLDVPENIMPSSPGQQLYNMHMLINSLFRKLKAQAQRQKTITAITGASEEDAKVVTDSPDGHAAALQAAQGITEMRFGGPDSQNHGIAIHFMQLFDQLGGGINAMLGSAPSADTVGQEKLLAGSRSAIIEKQRDRMFRMVEKIAKDIAWYRFNDPFYNPMIVKRLSDLPGLQGIQTMGSFAPQDRLGDFRDYNMKLEPYSMENQTPAEKLGNLQGILANVILPLAPFMMEQGIMLNMEAIIKMVARFGNMPELLEAMVFTQGEQIQRGQPMDMGQVFKPPQTRHESVRINRASHNQANNNDQLMRSLLGVETPQNQYGAS